MSLKKLKVIGLLITIGLSFLLHDLYSNFPSFLTRIFAPVNESIWEHMKIIFTSFVISSITQKIIVKVKKLDYNNICFSNIISGLLTIIIFLSIFLPIYLIFGDNLIVTIIIMILTEILGHFISYKIIQMKDLKLENIAIIITLVTYLIFLYLSYYPPVNFLFSY